MVAFASGLMMISTSRYSPPVNDLVAVYAGGLSKKRMCIDCFKPFHTVSSVSKLQSEVIKNKLQANGKK